MIRAQALRVLSTTPLQQGGALRALRSVRNSKVRQRRVNNLRAVSGESRLGAERILMIAHFWRDYGSGVGRQAGNDDLADAFVQAVNADDLGRAFHVD